MRLKLPGLGNDDTGPGLGNDGTYLPLLDHKLKESIWLLELGPPRLSHGQILSPVDLLQLQQREASAITQDTCRASHLFRVEGRRSKLFNTSFPLRCPPMDKYLYLHTHTHKCTAMSPLNNCSNSRVWPGVKVMP